MCCLIFLVAAPSAEIGSFLFGRHLVSLRSAQFHAHALLGHGGGGRIWGMVACAVLRGAAHGAYVFAMWAFVAVVLTAALAIEWQALSFLARVRAWAYMGVS